MKISTTTYLFIIFLIQYALLLKIDSSKIKKAISLTATEVLSSISSFNENTNNEYFTIDENENENDKSKEKKEVEKIDSIRIELTKIDINKNNNFVSLESTSKSLKKSSLFLNASSQEKIVDLKNYKNTQYIANLNVGTPSQQIPVILDSGSGNIFLNSIKCKKESCTSHIQYDYTKSSSINNLGLLVDVKFGSGQIKGEINEEKVSLAGLVVDNQRFGEIIDEKGDVFSDGYFSGILGFGFSSMSAYNSTTYFENVKKLGLLKQNIISFYYSIDENVNGEVIIGNINYERIIGDLHYFKVTEQYYWNINLKDILYNNKSLGLCDNGCKGIIDTGTSLITGPTKDVDKLLNLLPIESDCKNYSTTYDLTFVFNNDEGDFYYPIEKSIFVQKNENDCRSMIVPLDLPKEHGPAWVFGNIFMKKYYTIFNLDNTSVGFGLAKHG